MSPDTGSSRSRRTIAAASTSAPLRRRVSEDVAVLMLTNPNTLGVFEGEIEEVARVAARQGGPSVHGWRQPERLRRAGASGRHGGRCAPPQPAQDLFDAARRRRPRGADRSASARRWSRFCRCPESSSATAIACASGTTVRRSHRQGPVVPRELRNARPGLRLHPGARPAGAEADVGDGGAQRQLHPQAARRDLSPPVRRARRCTR